MGEAEHQRLLRGALERERESHDALLAGDEAAATAAFADTARRYRASWEAAPPRAFGRLIGLLKATVLAGADAREAADYVRGELAHGEDPADSAAAAYARALAALIAGDDGAAREAAAAMREGGEAFERTGRALAALADRDPGEYADALTAIVADFERRTEHLTGVAIADTAVVLERLAEARGIAARPDSALVPR